MNAYWNEIVNQLEPYVPGEQSNDTHLVKLNTNENPYPPSPKVNEAIAAVNNQQLRLYPDPESTVLKLEIAKYHQLSENQVFVGNGSDEVLAHVFKALFQSNKRLLTPQIGYSFYPTYAKLFDIEIDMVPMDVGLTINVDDYLRKNAGIVIANPNAMTGISLSLPDIEKLLHYNSQSVVVIDEAYVDFGAESAVQLIDTYPNLLIVQTFSKSRSMAGLRVGYALGHHGLIEGLNRVKNSFNSYPVNRLSQIAAIEAIKDVSYFEHNCRLIMDTRNKMVEQLKKLQFEVLPSTANFILVSHKTFTVPPRYACAFMEAMRDQGFLLRHFNTEWLKHYVRITVSLPQDCERLVDVVTAVINDS